MPTLTKRTAGIFGVWLVLLLLIPMSALATEAAPQRAVFQVQSEDSGYQIIVPRFIEYRAVNIDNSGTVYPVMALVIEKPKPDGNGDYPVFQIVTTDKQATIIESYPGLAYGEQTGYVYGEIKGGTFNYSLPFPIESDVVYSLDFYTDSGESFYDIFVMFADPGESKTVHKPAANGVAAEPNASKVIVNGKEIAFEAYTINKNNYFKLRDLAMAVNGTNKQFEVVWDGERKVIELNAGAAYEPEGGELAISGNSATRSASPTASAVMINGEKASLTVYTIANNNYFKLRDIAQAFNIGVTWNKDANTISIDTELDYIAE